MSSESNELREKGNEAFKNGQYQDAINRYTDALAILANLDLNDTNKTDLTKCYSNRSQCYINLGQYEDAIEDATRGRYSFCSKIETSNLCMFKLWNTRQLIRKVYIVVPMHSNDRVD